MTGSVPQSAAGTGSRPGQADPGVPGLRLLELVQVMDTLRRNCPWDARQTHASLMPYLLEETYEALDALAADDPAAVREELGDVLLQVMFHARIAAERTDGTGYDIDEVAGTIIDKLTRRHPHVFGDVPVSGADEVIQNWDTIKAAERAAKRAARAVAGGTAGAAAGDDGENERASALDGVPLGQPALSLAAQLLRRAGKAGVPAPLAEDGTAGSAAAGAARAESAGPAEAGAARAAAAADEGGAGDAAAAVGRELFALVRRAQEASVDPELALRAAALAYAGRVRSWETAAGHDRTTP